jgi:biotin carboxyl carrier protein
VALYKKTSTILWTTISADKSKETAWFTVFREKPVPSWSDNAMKVFASFAKTTIEAASNPRNASPDSDSDDEPLQKKPRPKETPAKETPPEKTPPAPKRQNVSKKLPRKKPEVPIQQGIQVKSGDVVTAVDALKNSVTGVVDRVLRNETLGDTVYIFVVGKPYAIAIKRKDITSKEAARTKRKRITKTEKPVPPIGSAVTFHHISNPEKVFTGVVTDTQSFHVRVACAELGAPFAMHKNRVLDCQLPSAAAQA